MTDAQISAAIASSVVALTRHVMDTRAIPDYEAYRLVTDTKLFALLSDPRTRFFLRTNAELCSLLDATPTPSPSKSPTTLQLQLPTTTLSPPPRKEAAHDLQELRT